MDEFDADAVARLVTVTECSSRAEAQIVIGALEAEGIRGVLFADDAGGIHPELSMLAPGGVRVAVDERDAEAARDLLEQVLRGDHALDDDPVPFPPTDERGVGAARWIALAIVVALTFLIVQQIINH